MRKRSVLSLAVAVAIAEALTIPISATAQAPTQDSVVASFREAGMFGSGYSVNVVSGPLGENPTGSVRVTPAAPSLGRIEAEGSPVCLKVTGNQATVVAIGTGTQGTIPIGTVVIKLTVVDEPVGLADRAGVSLSNDPSLVSCDTPLDTSFFFTGTAVVTDASPAPPRPTSKEQCKNDGWRQYEVFKNQGDCVSFVATGDRNQPGSPPA